MAKNIINKESGRSPSVKQDSESVQTGKHSLQSLKGILSNEAAQQLEKHIRKLRRRK